MLILLFFLLLPTICYSASVDRCVQYVHEVRVQHWKYFGLFFPYHYGVGQLRQESSCRADAVSFDGGKGLPQFMPATLKGVEQHLGSIDIFRPAEAIKAQAWYMATLHKGNFVAGSPLWITYMCYNSGTGTVKKEYRRANSPSYNSMRVVCKRRVLQLKSGPLDLCDVGYDYPIQIYKYGKKYQLFPDGMRYW